MKKVLIACDSTTDLSAELINKYDIRILPMLVTLGEKTYTDGVDLDPDNIYEHFEKTGELPKTTAINLSRFYDFFKECLKEAESVVFVTLGSDLSSTFNNARTVALDFDGIFVVDSKNLSTGGGLLVLKAAEMAEKGMDAAEIAEELKGLAPKVDSSFVINGMEYLIAGGRLSSFKGNAAMFLSIKPCIIVRDGKMIVGRKYHGKFSIVVRKYVNDILDDAGEVDHQFVMITHSGCDQETVDNVHAQLKEKGLFENIYVTRAGCTISSHCGPDTLGILFIRKNDINL
ncbi:MAG: DegV family protein [Erysipelotrichaceae bacterium]|nr:DegV family protein [Erysipelotrichaceae bacterium]